MQANGEMPFLYGGNVLKVYMTRPFLIIHVFTYFQAHVGRWSEDCPEHAGLVVLSMNDTPLVSFP